MTARTIAGWLGIAPTSVITHRNNAYARIGVPNQRALVQQFYASEFLT